MTLPGLIILELRLIKVNRRANILLIGLFLYTMTIRNRNRGLLVLMVSSIFLLLALQFMWLKDAYDKQEELLAEQADLLFVKTVRNQQDSLANKILLAAMEELDTSNGISNYTVKRRFSSKKEGYIGSPRSMFQIDTAVSTLIIRTDDSLQIDWESIPEYRHQRSIVRVNTPTIRPEGVPDFLKNVLISFTLQDTVGRDSLDNGKDTLSLDLLTAKYKGELLASEIDIEFIINRIKPQEEQAIDSSILSTSKIVANYPTERLYFAEFADPHWYLLQKITPDILLSLLLTFLTTLSFVLVFQNMKRQQRLTTLKNDLISNITHELKTPITTVGVAIEALSNFNALQDPERTKEYLEISRNELKRLSILVDKVLKTALFGEEEMKLKLEQLDLQQLIGDILSSMKLQFEKFAAQINFNVKGHSFLVNGDKIHLTSVIYNLLDNALKYSTPTPNPSIAVNLELQRDQLHLQVIDNGMGIPAEFKDKIFEKFFRVPTGDQHDIKGHGLGLNYVANVIRKHEGNIAVESEVGKGSTFTIKLPADHGAS